MSHLNVIAQTAISSFKHLSQLHAQIIHYSLHHHNYWISLLITHCTRLRAPPLYARLIFDSVHQPNVYVYTNMLKFYSQLGADNDVITLFHSMQVSRIIPDAFVYPILIKSCGRIAVELHCHVLKMGHECDCYVRNAVMDMYAKYGFVEFARKVFDEMSDRKVADWNSMISGYWRYGNDVEAEKLFNLMPERNVITWTAMVTGYSKARDLVTARRFFDLMPEKNVVSWNAMLSGYSQNEYAEETLELFKKMCSGGGVQPNETTWVAVISSCSIRRDLKLVNSLVKMISEKKSVRLNKFVKTALLDIYAKCGDLVAARKIFDELGMFKNVVAWNAMISAYARVGDLSSARIVFDKMPTKNVVSWNSLIAGYAQNGESTMAIEVFKGMTTSKDVKPDEVTMVSVISACGHLGALELGIWALKFIDENQITLSVSGYNAVIFMYSKCGNIQDAKQVFHNMKTKDVISFNTLITGFAAHGDGFSAVDLFYKMKEHGFQPDRITYIGVLTACSHAGLLEQGRRVFESISNPDVDHYACMIDLLGRVGQLDEAMNLIANMPMAPHAGVYGSLLNASRIRRRIDIGEFAARELIKIEPENSGNYVLLSNMYASLGKWGDVERIRCVMKLTGVKKITGWSWVEFNGKLHKFIVGDKSHERSNDIYEMLLELRKKMRMAGYVVDKESGIRDVEDEEKEEMVGTHSEKLAVSFAILVSEPGTVIRIVKNLRICWDCHDAMKMISKLEKREIIVRDNNRFHCFIDGLCSCKDYW
ncbi:pentatricopeptide repeat-containing protein At1g14470 isoform X2 [Rutidosis leptorrhynchoides]|uniref:pentatricopeptide repeat-containing protein At1g14470 isoform X2 n=1 Tax=Rutidosis leptorrhynchoides TaxID=125765 RepID=UPI003A994FBC